jgi:hypothetical protein
MTNAPNDDQLMKIRYRPLWIFVPYAGALVFSALTVLMSWAAATAGRDYGAVVAIMLLLILLIGFVAFMLWAGAFRRSRSPYMVVDFTAGAIVTISTFGRLEVVPLGTDERFAIEYGEDVDEDNHIKGERVVVVRADGHRVPTKFWKMGAHRADWAKFSRRLELE